nr:hypothetical protein 10 [bacterium]
MAFRVGEIEAKIGADTKGFYSAIKQVKVAGAQVAKDLKGKFNNMAQGMGQVGRTMSMGLTAPLVGAGALALKTSANFETLRQSMDILNGSVEEGAFNFERLQKFSAKTPFQLNDLAKAQNTLQGFGMEADDAFNSIKQIGDIASVTGGDIQSIAVAFGQSAAEGKLLTRDIRQLINQGVPATKLLAKSMGVAQDEIFAMAEAGEITFPKLQKAFADATRDGGMFANGMEKQSKTLAGVFSTLKDNVSIALAELGNSLNETFNITGLVGKITTFVQNVVSKFNALPQSVKKIGFIIAGILGASGPVMVALSAMIPAITAIGSAFMALVSPVGLVVGAIFAVGGAVAYIWDNWKAVKERISDISWWKNVLIQMMQWMIEYSPISLFIKGINKVLQYIGKDPIGNPFESASEGLEDLKTKGKTYATEFKSIGETVNSIFEKVAGFSIPDLFKKDQTQEVAKITRQTGEWGRTIEDLPVKTFETINTETEKTKDIFKDWIALGKEMTTMFLDRTISAFTEAFVSAKRFSTEQLELQRYNLQKQEEQLRESYANQEISKQEFNLRMALLGQQQLEVEAQLNMAREKLFKRSMRALVAAAKQAVRDMLAEFAKLAVIKGIGKLLGIDGASSFADIGGGLFKKLFSQSDALITDGGTVHKFHPQDNILAMKDFSSLNTGGNIDEGKLQRAFERALEKHTRVLGPYEIYTLGERGRNGI